MYIIEELKDQGPNLLEKKISDTEQANNLVDLNNKIKPKQTMVNIYIYIYIYRKGMTYIY